MTELEQSLLIVGVGIPLLIILLLIARRHDRKEEEKRKQESQKFLQEIRRLFAEVVDEKLKKKGERGI